MLMMMIDDAELSYVKLLIEFNAEFLMTFSERNHDSKAVLYSR